MNFEGNDYYRDLESLHDQCKKCAYYHVIITMKDGSTLDGIIEDVDMDGVNMLVGEDVMEKDDEGEYDQDRQYYMYGRPRRRFRRFRRRRFPLASLLALSLLPYPVIPPVYPYHNYY
jgi:small nuclear ribonucleoprotein (snRNP)-like protein